MASVYYSWLELPTFACLFSTIIQLVAALKKPNFSLHFYLASYSTVCLSNHDRLKHYYDFVLETMAVNMAHYHSRTIIIVLSQLLIFQVIKLSHHLAVSLVTSSPHFTSNVFFITCTSLTLDSNTTTATTITTTMVVIGIC